MQQQERAGSSEERKQHQDRRLKAMMQGGGGGGGGGGSEEHQQQPQKCPRCGSVNTKFCYYNNYSLSQPRYFCKSCRRYWTQGGNLRNVPVGGGCRKGKRTKSSSAAGEASQGSQQQPPPQQPESNLTTPLNVLSSNPVMTTGPPVLRTTGPAAGNLAAPSSLSSMGSYYPAGGFLSSLAAIQPQSFSHHPLHQSLNVGGADRHNIGGSSNLDLLHGFSTVPSFGQIFQMGNIERSVNPMYHNPSEESLNQSTRPDTALWNISSTSSGNTNSNTNTGLVSGSFNPNQWPDLPGYGPPP